MTDTEKTIYEDFVHFRNDKQMLNDTFMMYVMTPSFDRGAIMNAKKKFEDEFNIKIGERE